MFKMTNTGSSPLIYTDRFGRRQLIKIGQTREDLDFDQATGDYIAAVKERDPNNARYTISGKADGDQEVLKGPNLKGLDAVARQTGAARSGIHSHPEVTGSTAPSELQRQPHLEQRKADEAKAAAAMPTKSELEDMKRDELDELAEKHGLDPNAYNTKADLIKAMVARGKKE